MSKPKLASSKTHPMLRHRGFTVPCPPLREFEAAFNALVAQGELSMCCYGHPRVGKTMACAHLRAKLEERGSMVIHWATLVRDDKDRESGDSLYHQLLLGEGLKLTFAPTQALNALISRSLADADRLGTDKVLIAIDEAQNMTVRKWWMLKKLFDDLSEQGFAPFVLLMAQMEILDCLESLRSTQKSVPLVDRFLLRLHKYPGVKVADFANVLGFYDEARWPAAGPTFTEHFVPKLWAAGWRLRDTSPHFVGAFQRLAGELAQDASEFGMKYLTTSVRALMNFGAADVDSLTDLAGAVNHCVRTSGLIESSRLVGRVIPRKNRAVM
jgi:hypothetical protein